MRASAGSVLVLGFVEGGKPNSRIRQSVIQFLQRMGEEVSGASLSTSDQLCTQTDCLVRLGERNQAQRLIGGEIIPNDSSYRVLVWLFDRASEQPNSAEATCTDCNAEMLADLVARTAGQVLEVGLIAPSRQAPREASPPQTLAPMATPCAPAYRSFERGLAIGSLAAITAAGLVTGIALAGQSGQVYRTADGMTSDITYDFAPHSRLTLGLTALPALGLLAAVLPWHSILGKTAAGGCSSSAAAPQARGRRTFGRGLAIGALGSLSLAGLISAFTLTGLHGSVYGVNPDGTAITYNLKPHYQVAYGTSAGLLVGLGLAIFLP